MGYNSLKIIIGILCILETRQLLCNANDNQSNREIFSIFKENDDISSKLRLKRDTESTGRLLSPSTFSKITETLGALNTVGHWMVDWTRGEDSSTSSSSDENSKESVPNALLTLTKNVLGQNTTNTVEPLIKPTHQTPIEKKKKKKEQIVHQEPINQIEIKDKIDDEKSDITDTVQDITKNYQEPEIGEGKDGENRCKTRNGQPGRCQDLSSCPQLLLNLADLRTSLCFQKLFVPGVCCPVYHGDNTILTTAKPIRLTTKPPSLILAPVTTTVRPQVLIPQTTQSVISSLIDAAQSLELNGNTIDPNDCGQQEYTSGRVVGGVQSGNGEWPWMAAIFLHGSKRTEFWCGGSLIGTKYVLTAAHCTRDSRQRPFAAKQFTVRLGDIDLSTDSEPSAPATFKVTEVRAHPRFSRVGFYNDIAILVLDHGVRRSRYVIPVCLPKPGVLPSKERLAGRRATVVGWGTTYYGGKESTVQRQAELPMWRNEDCNRAYFQPITDNFLCAGYSEGGVDACQGDSGGPLMMQVQQRWIQLGIVSFGNKCGEPGYPGVYTRLTEYMDWINENTKN